MEAKHQPSSSILNIKKPGASIDTFHSHLSHKNIYFKLLKVDILTKQIRLNNIVAEVLVELFWIKDPPNATDPTAQEFDPKMYITNSFGKVHTDTLNRTVKRNDGIEVQIQRKKFKGLFIQKIVWNKFPFDDQRLEFNFLANNYREKSQVIVLPNPQPNHQFIFVALEPNEYILGDLEYILQKQNNKQIQPEISIIINVVRNPTLFIPFFFYELCLGSTIAYASGIPDSYCDYRYIYICLVFTLYTLLECRNSRYMPVTHVNHIYDKFHFFMLVYFFGVFVYASFAIFYYNEKQIEVVRDDFFQKMPIEKDYLAITHFFYVSFFAFLIFFTIYAGSSIISKLSITAEVKKATARESRRKSSSRKKTIVDDFNNVNNHASPDGSCGGSYISSEGMVVRSAEGDVCYFYANNQDEEEDSEADDCDDDDADVKVHHVDEDCGRLGDDYVVNFESYDEYFSSNTCIKDEEEEEDGGEMFEVVNSAK